MDGVTAFTKVIIAEPCSRAGSSSDDTYLRHVPWTGTSPPLPTKREDPSVFVRREGGVWCRRDTRNRMYPVSKQGERIAKPKVFSDGGTTSADQQRPPSVSPHFWWKVLSAAQRAQWWKENREEQAKASDPADSSTNNAAAGETAKGEDVGDDHDPWDDIFGERWANIIDM